jgi:surface-anchored protein
VNLVGVRFFDLAGNAAEAEFSLWTIESGGQPVVWMSTAEGGITAEALFFILEGGHSHANWGFSRAGYYQIDFQLSGHLTGTNELVESPVTTWHFGVEHLPVAIPEPSTLWLLAAALATGAWIRFRRRAHVARR